MMDSIGPYPILLSAATAAVDQGTDSPPEWRQGAVGLSERFASNMGVDLVGNTTRFGLAALLKQDTQYYRCRCDGAYRRARHAVLSAVIGRRFKDGRQVFSLPNLLAPYVATTTEVYGWYPSRFGAKDAFRMGNYNLLGSVTSNVVFELMPHKVWDLLGKVHMDSRRMAGEP